MWFFYSGTNVHSRILTDNSAEIGCRFGGNNDLDSVVSLKYDR